MAEPGEVGGQRPQATGQDCELCEAARLTRWYHEDEVCWVADCEICDVPMVVWRHHGRRPPAEAEAHMLERLQAVADQRFGQREWSLDQVMRQIPDHFHAHARDEGWWLRRFARRESESGTSRQRYP